MHYIVEEPVEIHLMSVAYFFDLSRSVPGVSLGTAPAAIPKPRQSAIHAGPQDRAGSGGLSPASTRFTENDGFLHPSAEERQETKTSHITSSAAVLPESHTSNFHHDEPQKQEGGTRSRRYLTITCPPHLAPDWGRLAVTGEVDRVLQHLQKFYKSQERHGNVFKPAPTQDKLPQD